MIVVIDYNLGNIKSVFRGFEKIGAPVKISSSASDIDRSDGMVLPGVGAFRKAMENLESLGLTDKIKKNIFSGKPYLGICLGLQVLFSSSCEHGETAGLNIIKGKVKKFGSGVKIPHMGWNNVRYKEKTTIFNGVESGSYFYFDHSYYVEPSEETVCATTVYGNEFTSAVVRNNIYGVQFHPEKSGEKGLKMLKNFSEICLPKE